MIRLRWCRCALRFFCVLFVVCVILFVVCCVLVVVGCVVFDAFYSVCFVVCCPCRVVRVY